MKKESLKIFDKLSERAIAYRPVYARICGSVTGGVLLSQLVYWGKASRWKEFYKTDNDLRTEICFSRHELLSAKKKVQSLGFVKTDVRDCPPKTYYTLNLEEIIKAISACPEHENSLVRKADNYSPETGQMESDKRTINVRNSDNYHTENNTKNKTKRKALVLKDKPDVHKLIDHCKNEYRRILGIPNPHINGAVCKTLKTLLETRPADQIKTLVTQYLSLEDQTLQDKGFPIQWLPNRINELLINHSNCGGPTEEELRARKEREDRARKELDKKYEVNA